MQEKDSAQAKREALSARPETVEIKERLARLKGEMVQLQGEVNRLGGDPDPAELKRVDVETDRINGETKRLERELARLELKIAKEAVRQKRKEKGWKRELLEWVATLAIALVIALPVRTFVFSFYFVEGTSMSETLADREIMFSTKYDYLLGDPQRFDVVICRYPNRAENFVKRVVGVPGDTVAVSEGTLYVNGEPVDEPYITYRPNYTLVPYTVGEGEYFVLGDNRANSNDSHTIGPLLREQILAHVRFVVYPFGAMRGIELSNP